MFEPIVCDYGNCVGVGVEGYLVGGTGLASQRF